MNIGRNSRDQKYSLVTLFLYSVPPTTAPGLKISAAANP